MMDIVGSIEFTHVYKAEQIGAGLNEDGTVKQPIDSNNFESDITPLGNGLYLTRTYIGLRKNSVWTSYIQNDGKFAFKGDADNYIQWDGAKLNVKGEVQFTGNTTIDGSLIVNGTITGTKLATATITGDKITAGTIEAGNIKAGTIEAGNIKAGTIEAINIKTATITGLQISASTIEATNIKAGTITGDRLVASTITATQIATGTITATQIAASTITGDKIAAIAITAEHIATNTITANQIAAGTITANRIAAATITGDKIAAATITGDRIAATTISADNIVSGTITATQIAASTITASNIATGTITATQIATGTITATQIASGTITSDKITSKTISADKLSVVTRNYLNSFQDPTDGLTGWTTSGVIETVDSYRCLAVTAPSNSFTSSAFEVLPDDILEFSFALATPIHSGGSGIFLGLTNGQSFKARTWNSTTKVWGASSDSTNAYFISNYLTTTKTFFKTYILGSNVDISSIPAPATGAGHTITCLQLQPGAISCHIRPGYNATNAGNKWQLFHPRLINRAGGIIIASNIESGSITATQIAAGAITASQIASGTITASQIASGTITGTQIAASTITADKIAASTITSDKLNVTSISSITANLGTVTAGLIQKDTDNYWNLGTGILRVGSSTKYLNFDGTNLVIETPNFKVSSAGNATLTGGTIGGFTIGSTSLIAGTGATRVSVSTADGIHLGHDTFASAPFRVTRAGAVTATSGTVGGWTLAASSLTGGSLTLTNTGNITAGTVNDVARISADNATDRLWIGHATSTSAPFRVSKAGALTATGATISGAITATSGSFTGSITAGTGTIGGTTNGWEITAGFITALGTGKIRTSSTTTRTELDSTGLKAYNAGTERARIGNDGAGFLGASNIISWTNAGAVTVGGFTVNNTTLSNNNLSLVNTGNITAGTSNDVIRISADNTTDRLWIGHATNTSAPFRVSKAGVLTATGATISGAITATSGSFTGSITSTSGTIGDWILGSNVIKSANSGARVELNKSSNRVSIFDSTTEKVALGYLNGLLKPHTDPPEYFTPSDYGFWVAPGQAFVFSGDMKIDGDALSVTDGHMSFKQRIGSWSNEVETMRVGNADGSMGIHKYDTVIAGNKTSFTFNHMQGASGYGLGHITIRAIRNNVIVSASVFGTTLLAPEYTESAAYIGSSKVIIDGLLLPWYGIDDKSMHGIKGILGSFGTYKNPDNTVFINSSHTILPTPTQLLYPNPVFIAESDGTLNNKKYLVRIDMTTKFANWDTAYSHSQSAHLALGTTSGTAYRGDYGNTAYTHAGTTTGNIHGSTTVGGNILRLTNPSAITFLRINADNTISTLTGANFRTAIGAGIGNSDLALGTTSDTAYRGDHGLVAYNYSQVHSQVAHLALGTTSSTAYRGDHGLAAYTHSQSGPGAHGESLSGVSISQTPNGIGNRFIRLTDNAVTIRSAAEFRADIGAGTSSLELGGTISTAYRGDHGLAAYNHSLIVTGHAHNSTDVGINIFRLPNPMAIRYIQINANNSITALTGAELRVNIGAGTSSLALGETSLTAYRGDNGASAFAHAGTITGSIHGSTYVGENILRLPNPTSIRFLRINADNTVSTLTGIDFRAAIGAGTGNSNLALGTSSSTAYRGDHGLAAYDHISADGSSHSFINQSVTTGATPTFSRLTLNVATGTAPMTITSTTRVANLNVATAGYADSAGSITSQANSATITAATAGTANQIALRDASGDITTRLFRATHADQATISGAIAFRFNTTDNYTRYCSDTGAIRTFLGVGTGDSPTFVNLTVTGKAPAPIGMTYFQLPNESQPSDIFTGTWTLQAFDGMFFRAEGGNSKTWANTTKTVSTSTTTVITFTATHGLSVGDMIRNSDGVWRTVSVVNSTTQVTVSVAFASAPTGVMILAQGDAIRNITGTMHAVMRDDGIGETWDGAFAATTPRSRSWSGTSGDAVRSLTFNASRVVPTAVENRPLNVAIRVWKRTS
jgi:hypothetical protein